MSRRLLLVSLAALGVAVLVPAASAHHGNPYAYAEVAKHKHGPWSANPIDVTIPTGRKKNLFVRITNTTPSPHELHLRLYEATDQGPPAYEHDWFADHESINHAVGPHGYRFDLKPDKTKLFRVRIRANDGSVPECLFAHFHVNPEDLDMFPGFYVNGSSGCPL